MAPEFFIYNSGVLTEYNKCNMSAEVTGQAGELLHLRAKSETESAASRVPEARRI